MTVHPKACLYSTKNAFADAGLDSVGKLSRLTSVEKTNLLAGLKAAEGSQRLHIKFLGRGLEDLAAAPL